MVTRTQIAEGRTSHEIRWKDLIQGALAMVFALHKFRHYLLGNKFVFYVDHMALVYLVNKLHVLGK
jgi:hypothetical protein